MSRLGRRLRGVGSGRVAFMCPGCGELHQVTVDSSTPGPVWSWNRDVDRPTFMPSVRVTGAQRVIVDGKWVGEWVCDANDDPLPSVCHSFVVDGRIQFLTDCTHALAGQTVELPDIPEEQNSNDSLGY